MKKLGGWKERTLSQAGKEVLIKVIAQAIPTYTMSCFAFPIGLCTEIKQLLCKFWWGSGESTSKIHWMKWKCMCLPKNKGGLGFRDMENFNLALLARQGWQIIQDPDSLISRLLKARYFPRSDFLNASVGFNPSYSWRSILKGREVLAKGLLWSIGNGSEVLIAGFRDHLGSKLLLLLIQVYLICMCLT